MYEREREYASKGVAGTGLGLGIAGTVGLVNQLAGGLFGGVRQGTDCCVNRFELEQQSRISRLESDIALRDANTYAMQQMNEFRNYVDKKFDCINEKLSAQAVINEKIIGNLTCLTNQVASLDALTSKIIPKSSICPEVMERYNSWVAPSSTPAANSVVPAAQKAA